MKTKVVPVVLGTSPPSQDNRAALAPLTAYCVTFCWSTPRHMSGVFNRPDCTVYCKTLIFHVRLIFANFTSSIKSQH